MQHRMLSSENRSRESISLIGWLDAIFVIELIELFLWIDLNELEHYISDVISQFSLKKNNFKHN